jgi:hypothetical protein
VECDFSTKQNEPVNYTYGNISLIVLKGKQDIIGSNISVSDCNYLSLSDSCVIEMSGNDTNDVIIRDCIIDKTLKYDLIDGFNHDIKEPLYYGLRINNINGKVCFGVERCTSCEEYLKKGK